MEWGNPCLRHPGQASSIALEQKDSQERQVQVPSAACGCVGSTHPVKGVRVEGVVGVLPVRFSSGLKTDLPDCENITFVLSFISNLNRGMRRKVYN